MFAFFPFSKLRSAFSFSFCSPLYCNKGGLPGGLGPFRPRRTDGSAPCATTGAFLDNASFARFGPVGLLFFLVDAGSFLDSARRQSGVLVKFLHPPRSFLIGKNAAATSQPSLLVAGFWPQLCRDVIRGVQTRAAACPRRVDIYLRSASAEAV